MGLDLYNSDTLHTTPSEQERLSQRLREAREYLGLSQEHVAVKLNISRAALSAMETAKRKVSSLELKALSRIYGKPYEYFLGQDELPTEDSEQDRLVTALYRTTKGLSSTDREQVLRFAQFLKQAPPPSKAEVDLKNSE